MDNPEKAKIDLAKVNNALALDRTLFAAIRTALSLTGFGFTLAKCVHDMIKNGALHGVKSSYPREIGLALMGLGLATLVGGVIEHIKLGRRIHDTGFTWSVSLIVAVGLVLLAIMLIWNLLTEIN